MHLPCAFAKQTMSRGLLQRCLGSHKHPSSSVKTSLPVQVAEAAAAVDIPEFRPQHGVQIETDPKATAKSTEMVDDEAQIEQMVQRLEVGSFDMHERCCAGGCQGCMPPCIGCTPVPPQQCMSGSLASGRTSSQAPGVRCPSRLLS